MGEFCAVWVMAVPMGVSRLKSSGGCVPAWISEEHIEIKSTDSIVCLLKRCVTHKEKSQAAFQVSQQCQRINIRPRLQWGASYDVVISTEVDIQCFNSLCVKEWGWAALPGLFLSDWTVMIPHIPTRANCRAQQRSQWRLCAAVTSETTRMLIC